MSTWTDLADRLRQRYPDDWAERYQSYRDGTNRDLHKWNALGARETTESRKLGVNPSPAQRYERIRAAAKEGLPLDLLAERFGMTKSGICSVLRRFGERAQR